MHRPRFDDVDSEHLTLRARRFPIALVAAVLVHGAAVLVMSQLPTAKKVPNRIELTIARGPVTPVTPATPAAPDVPDVPPAPQPRKRSAPPAREPAPTSPVVPEAPPDDEGVAVPEEVAAAPERAAPAPSSWKDSLQQQLAATRAPTPRLPSGELMPSAANLERVAMADPKMHDESAERRLMQDHGAFFRRGLEALRGNWHPDEVLNVTERDPSRKCGQRNRTTFAVAVLDKQGNVVDVDLKNPSGCNELDAEAVAAFKRVARFPHPPEGIFIGPDGTPHETARYPVRFIVTFDGGIRLDYWRGT